MDGTLGTEADLVVRNASIFTSAEGASSTATGFAVRDGKFIAVTNDSSTLEQWIGSETIVKDMDSAPIVPGLFDAHIHPIIGGKTLVKELTFRATLSLNEVLLAIDSWAKRLNPKDAWVTG